MKIRTDFVTNSSSSSFILAYKKVPDKHIAIDDKYIETYQDRVKELILRVEGCETSLATVVKNKKDLEKYFIEMYGYDGENLEQVLEDDYYKSQYDFVLDYLNKGYVIMYKSIDYNDSEGYDLVDDLADGDNFIVLDSD